MLTTVRSFKILFYFFICDFHKLLFYFDNMNVQDYGTSLRSKAIGMLIAGETTRNVALTLNVNIRSVQRWGRSDKLGLSMESKPKSGRPPKIGRVAEIVIAKSLGK